MKKRAFVLLELLIAFGLFAFFSLPLVHGLSFHVKAKRNRLLDLEKEMRAEELFYKICEKLSENHKDLITISNGFGESHTLDFNTITFDLGRLGKKTLFWHYHLYDQTVKYPHLHLLRCKICFLEGQKAKCDSQKSLRKADYGFALMIKSKP